MAIVSRLKQGDMAIIGEVNERLPSVTNGLLAHFPFDETVRGINHDPIMDYSIWKDGQTGGIGSFGGYSSGNSRIVALDPWGSPTVVWKSVPNGGIYHSSVPIDNTKLYRMTWWEKRVDNAAATYGRYYAGLNGYGSTNGVCNLSNGAYNTNPYFWSTNHTGLTEGEWFLFVGHVFPHDHTGTSRHVESGVYKIGGAHTVLGTDYKWGAATTSARSRTLAIYQGDDAAMEHHTVYPRMEICDGTEPTIEELLTGENNIIHPSANTNTTFTPSGIAVEEATTNHLMDGLNGYTALNPAHWNGDGGFTQVGVSSFDTPIIRYDTAGSSYRYTHDYILDDDLTTLSGKTVTFSLYLRRLEGPATAQIRIYDNVSGYSYQSVPVTDVFQKVQVTKTIGASPTRMFVMIDSTGGGTYDLHSPQLESKAFATSFTNATRGLPQLKANPDFINFNEGTMACRFTPSKGFFTTSSWNRVFGHSTGTNKNEIQVKRNSTGSNLVMSISNNAGTPQTSWSSCPSVNLVAGQEYHVVAKWSIAQGTMSLTVNGVKNEQAWISGYMPTIKGVVDIGMHSFTSRIANGEISDFSIYDRALTDEEIKKLDHGAFSIGKEGAVNSKIKEQPLNIKPSMNHFTLGGHTMDVNEQFGPMSDAGVSYKSGAIWLGSSTTNVASGALTPYTPYNTLVRSGQNLVFTMTGANYLTVHNGTDYNGQIITLSGYMRKNGLPHALPGSRANTYHTVPAIKWYFDAATGYFEIVENCNASSVWLFHTQSGAIEGDIITVDDFQVEQKTFVTPLTNEVRADSSLQYNLYESLGLDWSGNWSIVYWKKPIATHTDNLTGYSIDSLGSNSNSVGGGYLWWGKTSGSNAIHAATPGTIIPSEYFGNWRMISLVKSGTTLTVKEWEKDGAVRTRTVSVTTSLANYYVNHHGYDFKLAGWDNTNPTNAYYRDLVVSKTSLSDNELRVMHGTQMRASKENTLQIQGQLKEGEVL